jgi:hypothetical protein
LHEIRHHALHSPDVPGASRLDSCSHRRCAPEDLTPTGVGAARAEMWSDGSPSRQCGVQLAGTIPVRWPAVRARSTTIAMVAARTATTATITVICQPVTPLATTEWVTAGRGLVRAPLGYPPKATLIANADGAETAIPNKAPAKMTRKRTRWGMRRKRFMTVSFCSC